MMNDPVERPDFNPFTYRDPNPETMATLKRLTKEWRLAEERAHLKRAGLNAYIVYAKDTGHSFNQIRDATGLGTGSIQMILAKAGRL